MQRDLRAAGAITSVSSPSKEVEHQVEKYLTFRMGADVFAVPFVRVREIMGIQEIKVVPESPVFLKGVIDLRGKIVPVVELRLKFGLPGREYKSRTCIVFVHIENAQIKTPTAGKLMMRIVVESVPEAHTFRASHIRNAVA